MSGRDLHQRATALFLEMRELPHAQREHHLWHATDGDEPLRLEVQSLLGHDTLANHADDATDRGATAASLSRTSGMVWAETPERIGPYRVLQRIGRGGSGFVLLAEQEEPVRRRVAIKIVPHAALHPEFAARFEVERRALERTEHPNIARILDTGRTHDGLPYLVMDYVEEAPVADYCRQHALGLRERIGLMLQISDAVQHAHQRGVIHRDLKPANILVTDTSGRATPRVLDFGIAKPIPEMWLGGSDSPPTVGLPLGTPAYMAPEQTGLAPVDTRADVYALGAILYELTCGRSPNDVQGDAMQVLQRIREAVPPPASRVRAQHMQRELNGRANDSPPTSMLSDLDCILAKALEKDPSRRYPAVSAFAMDLQRLLRSEPIEARPATRRYRAARFVQRNRVLVGASALALLALLAGVVGLALGLIEARQQRREAMNQTDSQREINRFLTDDLLAAASPEEEGANITALDLLHRAGSRVDARFAARPNIAASIHHTLGVAYSTLGELDSAQTHLDRSMQLRTAAIGPNAPDTVRTEVALASLQARRQKLAEADVALTAAVTRARLILGPDDPALYAALNDLGTVYETMDRGPEAVAILQEALTGRRRVLGDNDPQVPLTMSNLAMAYERVGKEEESLQMQIEALRIAERMQPPPRYTILGLNNNVGATYQDLNRDKEAETYLRRAAALANDWLGDEHPDTLTLKANLAGLESDIGDPNEAMRLLDDVIRIRMRDLGPAAWDTLSARYAYWNAMWKAKRFDDAAKGLAEFLPQAEAALKEDHWFIAQTRASLALALLNGGRPQEALPHAEKAVARFTALYGPDHERTSNASTVLQDIRLQLAK